LAIIALVPTATFEYPLEFDSNALEPMAVFELPVEFSRASYPIPVLVELV